MTPPTTPLLKDSPPSSPTTPLLPKEREKPVNGFVALKLAYPFKGSLKKPSQGTYVAPGLQENGEHTKANGHEVEGTVCIQQEKRSIKWLDNLGEELFEVKEFEPSECESSDDDDDDRDHCVCAIQ